MKKRSATTIYNVRNQRSYHTTEGFSISKDTQKVCVVIANNLNKRHIPLSRFIAQKVYRNAITKKLYSGPIFGSRRLRVYAKKQ